MREKERWKVFASICLARNDEQMQKFLEHTSPKACAELMKHPIFPADENWVWGKQQVLKRVLSQPRLEHVHLVNMPQYLCAKDQSIVFPLWSALLDGLYLQPPPVQKEILNAVLTEPRSKHMEQYHLVLTLCTHPQATRYNRFQNNVVFRWCESFHLDHAPARKPLWDCIQNTISPEEMNEVMRWEHRDRMYFNALDSTPLPIDHWLSICDLKPDAWKKACAELWEETRQTLLDQKEFGILVPEFDAWAEKIRLLASVNMPPASSALRKL